jgi:hypothetical protein
MGFMTTVLVLVPAALLLGVAVLTGVGSRRRGSSVVVTTLSGVFFPVAWVVWYGRDMHPCTRRPA